MLGQQRLTPLIGGFLSPINPAEDQFFARIHTHANDHKVHRVIHGTFFVDQVQDFVLDVQKEPVDIQRSIIKCFGLLIELAEQVVQLLREYPSPIACIVLKADLKLLASKRIDSNKL